MMQISSQLSSDVSGEELTTKTTPKRSTYEHKNHQWLYLRLSECDSDGIPPQLESVAFVMYNRPNK